MKKYEIIYITFEYDFRTTIVFADSEEQALEKVDKKLGTDFKIFRELKHKQ